MKKLDWHWRFLIIGIIFWSVVIATGLMRNGDHATVQEAFVERFPRATKAAVEASESINESFERLMDNWR